MTSPLDAARAAQRAFTYHTAYCLAFALRHPCRTCRLLELTTSAAYARADASADAARRAAVGTGKR